VLVNNAAVDSADELRTRLAALTFLPDRLVLVKGGPLVRRSYFDRMLGRLFPARAALPADYGRALAQRNESLRRARTGFGLRDAIGPWTEQVATTGTELDAARAELIGLLAPRFAAAAAALALPEAMLRYEPRPLRVTDLQERLGRDIDRGATGVGPHLRDVEILAGGRELRGFGSQGEQRTAVLALVLSEADLMTERNGSPPLLLLDDVLSEFDRDRRQALLERLPAGGQTVITATGLEAVPLAAQPDLVVRVSPGLAVAA
jgi:DNA replication and repair protein RecF